MKNLKEVQEGEGLSEENLRTLEAGDSVASSAYYEVRVTNQEEFDAAVAAVGTHLGLLDRIVCDIPGIGEISINQSINSYAEIVLLNENKASLKYSALEESQGSIVLSSTRRSIVAVSGLKVKELQITKGYFKFVSVKISSSLIVLDSKVILGPGITLGAVVGINSDINFTSGTVGSFISYNCRLSGSLFNDRARQVEFGKTANGYVPALPEDFVSQDTTPKLLGGGGWVSVDQATGKNSVQVVDVLPSDLTGLKDGDIIILKA